MSVIQHCEDCKSVIPFNTPVEKDKWELAKCGAFPQFGPLFLISRMFGKDYQPCVTVRYRCNNICPKFEAKDE